MREFRVGDRVTHLIHGNCEVTRIDQNSPIISCDDGVHYWTDVNGYPFGSADKEAPPIMFHGHDVAISVVAEGEKIPVRTITRYFNLNQRGIGIYPSIGYKSQAEAIEAANKAETKPVAVGVPVQLF